MTALGPFEPAPRIAAGVSGGADSMALALLADAWARERGGSLLALVVDHGLRAESGGEAASAAARLGSLGIAAKVLKIEGLARARRLAERARSARFAVLEAACAHAGILHLLLGHHAGDQAETLLIRSLGGSGPAGLAGMAPLVETTRLRLLRPLLAVAPARLRATLVSAGVAWIEDPSNADTTALRPRLRLLRRDRDGDGAATAALVAAAAASGRQSRRDGPKVAASLAEQAVLRPEGFAVLSGQPLGAARARGAAADARRGAVSAGHPIDRRPRRGAAAGDPGRRPAAAGWPARSRTAGRARACRDGAAGSGAGRRRLGRALSSRRGSAVPPGATLGALDGDAARLRRFSPLPSAVLRTLPAVRQGATLLAVPHLHYPDPMRCADFPMLFSPPRPAVAAPFWFGDA